MKNLLSKERDPAKGLLAYRSTPLAFKFSPAQLLMGRQIRYSVPVFHTQLHPQWPDLENLREKESMSKLKQQTVFNSRHKGKRLPPIGPGTKVFVKDLHHSGKVIEAAVTPRSYKVETLASTIRRNRVHLTSLPDQLENEQLNPEEKQVPAESKAATPIPKDVPVSKRLSSTPRNTFSCY